MRALGGIVIAVQANYYWVQLDDRCDRELSAPEPWPHLRLLCTRRERLKKIGQKVLVGDQVTIAAPDWPSQRGVIDQVGARTSELDRPPVANADQILLVFAMAEPQLDPHQLSRFLIKAESTGLAVQLCLSKCDLVPPAEQQNWRDRLSAWGYPPLLLSTYAGIGLSALQATLDQRITVVSGPSGVGKSSLINQLIPQTDIRVAAVSGKLQRGRHTTRHVELFALPGGGLLADTPGFNQPDFDCLPEALSEYFPEIRQRRSRRQGCQFNNCRHWEEPGCVVRGQWERYPLYVQFLQLAIAQQQQQQQQSDPDASLKQTKRDKNTISYEPRLAKKYRQESRRSHKQSTTVFKGNTQDWVDGDDY
jgi:ribosome biogenesis GTPase / thiamine phosphate phosphatase